MKHYEKPQLFMEEFTLSQNIAIGCNSSVEGYPPINDKVQDNKRNSECVYEIDGGTTFFATAASCEINPDDPGFSLCYHGNPDNSFVFFFS